MRPEREAQITQNHHRLHPRILERGNPLELKPGARLPFRRRVRQQWRKQQPRGRQTSVQPPPPLPDLTPRFRQKRAVVQERDQGRCDHDGFTGHSQRATDHGADLPPIYSRRAVALNDAVQREQIEQAHQRLASLDRIGHALRLQRMDQPDQRDRPGQRRRGPAERGPQGFRQQRSPHHSEQGQRHEDVNDHIEHVVPPWVETTQRVVRREGQIHDRP